MPVKNDKGIGKSGVSQVAKYKEEKRQSLKRVDEPASLRSTSSSMASNAQRLSTDEEKQSVYIKLNSISDSIQKNNIPIELLE